ncbi:MAG: hypothetical protein IPJ03_10355 [Ignavibacteriales bacterium]|nr:hypothetical protein [Ignavibacteriales bacterium]
MLLLGILAIVQTVYLPGFVFTGIFNIKTTSTIQKWIYFFAISLFSNYAIVTILTLFGFYKSSVFYIIIAIEVVIIAYLVIAKKSKIDLGFNFRQLILDFLSFCKSVSISERVLIIITTLVVLFYLSLFISNLGTIFYFVDTVKNIHWNTWAIDFANNSLPKESSHFPQLIPANWSISYLLIGEKNVHFFPKSFMPLFFLGNVFMFLDLFFSKKNYVYLVALIIYGFFAPIIYNLVFIADGNADLPVSFFTFLSFYAYLKTDKDKFELKELGIVFLFASTAAGTKLAGFYVFFFISILCLYHFIKSYKRFDRKQIPVLAVSIVVILSINLFWYFLKPETMASGLHQPEWLVQGYANILNNALHLAYYNIGLPVIAFFIIALLFSLFTKESRYVTIFFVIPPIILWMYKYSADFRNLSFVVPFISYASAFGLFKIIKILQNKELPDNIVPGTIIKTETNKKTFWSFVFLIPAGLVCFFLIETNYFYQILYSVYSFISKYYFQSHRISYLIDFTFFLPVDYYQKVFAIMFLLLSLAGVLYLSRTRMKDVLIVLSLFAIFSNFTFITRATIINHQKEEFAKVDARNYYQTISTITKNTKKRDNIVSNFYAICSEKIQREIDFTFVENQKLLDSLISVSTLQPKIFFVHLKAFEASKQMLVRNIIEGKKFHILFDDGDYILFSNEVDNAISQNYFL